MSSRFPLSTGEARLTHSSRGADGIRGGLFNRHGCGQEQYAWDMRTEPALIDAFAKIWGTEELLVSIGEPHPPQCVWVSIAEAG